MAEGKQKKPGNAGRTASRASRKKPEAGKASGKGVKALRKAANQKVEQKSDEIAQKLIDLTLDGDLKSAQMLLDLAELEPEPVDGEGPGAGWSLALALAAQPQWHGELSEQCQEEMETGCGESEGCGEGTATSAGENEETAKRAS